MDPAGGAAPSEPTESGGGGAEGSDEAVAQGYFDEWSERVDSDITNLKEAFAHLMQVQGPGGSENDAGYSANQSAAGSPAGQQNQVSPSAGGGGQSLPAAPGGVTGEPEQAPKPAHPYWRRLFGG